MKSFNEIEKAADAPDWQTRKEAAIDLAELISETKDDDLFERARSILLELINDKKWEVRLAVIDASTSLPGSIFNVIIAQLIEDSNRYVKGAAQRARRQRDQTYRGKEDNVVIPSLEKTLSRLDKLLSNNPEAKKLTIHAVQQARMYAVAEFAHELKNLLHPLTSAVSRLNNDLSDGQKKRHKRTLTKILNQNKNLADFAENMRFVAEGKDLQFETVSCRVINEMVSNNVNAKSTEMQVTLRFPQPTEIMFRAVTERLVRALANIVLNAIEASLPGGVVEVQASQLAGGEIEFTIRDDGVGIDQDSIETNFAPLASGKRDEGHLGMGLYLAREVIQIEHHGNIDVESEEGKGTIFRVRLPQGI